MGNIEHALVIERDGLPRQRRRNLQCHIFLWQLAIVAQRDRAAGSERMRGRINLHLQLIVGEGEGLAIE